MPWSTVLIKMCSIRSTRKTSTRWKVIRLSKPRHLSKRSRWVLPILGLKTSRAHRWLRIKELEWCLKPSSLLSTKRMRLNRLLRLTPMLISLAPSLSLCLVSSKYSQFHIAWKCWICLRNRSSTIPVTWDNRKASKLASRVDRFCTMMIRARNISTQLEQRDSKLGIPSRSSLLLSQELRQVWLREFTTL